MIWAKGLVIFCAVLWATAAPAAIESVPYLTGVNALTAFEWNAKGELFLAEKSGIVKVHRNGELQAEPFIDLSREVNDLSDRGLVGMALHPDFARHPYVYLLYTYDPPPVWQAPKGSPAGPDREGNRVARLLRVRAEERAGRLRAETGSGTILLGKQSTWENISHPELDSTKEKDVAPSCSDAQHPNGTIDDCVVIDSLSHAVGDLEFLPDGTLLVSFGDGASYNFVDARAVRAQDFESLSGKILRIDAMTGDGVPGNPRFDPKRPFANASRVYALGFRNPFRMHVDDRGRIFVGDVGWFSWEEVNLIRPGGNYGWPFYEGKGDGVNAKTPHYEYLPEAKAFYAKNPGVEAPFYSYATLAVQPGKPGAISLGTLYRKGGFLPERFDGSLLITDVISGETTAIFIDEKSAFVRAEKLDVHLPLVTQLKQGPGGAYFFSSLQGPPLSRLVEAD